MSGPELPEQLFLDPFLLVINKPAGLLTLPDGYDLSLPHVRAVLEPHYGRLWIVHRLDRDTSGALALARTAEAHRSLNTQFEQHQVLKVYHALVAGQPEWEETSLSLPLRTNVGHRHRTMVDPRRGKPAVTRFRVLERLQGCALVEAIPETGRTHQIRAHLAALGVPLLADPLYSSQPAALPLPPTLERLCLHARRLVFAHPASSELVEVLAPYPQAFEAALAALRLPG